jgi:hypothetical protein
LPGLADFYAFLAEIRNCPGVIRPTGLQAARSQQRNSGAGDIVPFAIGGVQIRKMEVLCSVSYQNVFRLTEKQEFRFLCILGKDGNYQWMLYDGQRGLHSAARQ